MLLAYHSYEGIAVKKTRKVQGRQPALKDGWSAVGVWREGECVNWLVFVQPQKNNTEWRTYKVVAQGRAENKANYWFVMNLTTGQIGYGRDYKLLREHRPKLYEHLQLVLAEQRTADIL